MYDDYDPTFWSSSIYVDQSSNVDNYDPLSLWSSSALWSSNYSTEPLSTSGDSSKWTSLIRVLGDVVTTGIRTYGDIYKARYMRDYKAVPSNQSGIILERTGYPIQRTAQTGLPSSIYYFTTPSTGASSTEAPTINFEFPKSLFGISTTTILIIGAIILFILVRK